MVGPRTLEFEALEPLGFEHDGIARLFCGTPFVGSHSRRNQEKQYNNLAFEDLLILILKVLLSTVLILPAWPYMHYTTILPEGFGIQGQTGFVSSTVRF